MKRFADIVRYGDNRNYTYELKGKTMVLNVFRITVLIAATLNIPIAFGQGKAVMTVTGPVPMDSLGKTLIHEHIITDFSGTKSRNVALSEYMNYTDSILPSLLELKAMGYRSFVECTPAHIGRNVEFLKYLSKKSGLNILTNTGFYAAVDKKYLPPVVGSSTAEELAAIWEKEWAGGIEGTPVLPAFIKLGVGSGPLDPVEEKLVSAGMLLSKRTGLPLYVHTGGDRSIESQLELAHRLDFDPGRLVWVHAQNGSDEQRVSMAKQGVWVSLDGVNETRLPSYISMISTFRDEGLLHKLLISHDDGWGLEPRGGIVPFNNGNTRRYATIDELLLPALLKKGFTKDQINTLLIENPKMLFGLSLED